MRQALWITRFDWNDRDDLTALVERAIEAGVTDLLTQVRGAGDALYRSETVPASPKIASQLGGQPEWDPLDVVCRLAEASGHLRVHAWVNVLSGWPATSPAACEGLAPSPDGMPDHLMLRNPDAVLVDGSGQPMPCPNESDYVWVAPRHPAVIAELEAVATELVARYPLAGVHLDRIRYPGHHWRSRDEYPHRVGAVTDLVRRIRTRVPYELELTASLVPDYGSSHDGEPDHLAEFGQDGWRWVADGLVDSIMPMVYTPIDEGSPHDWHRLVHEHRTGVGSDRCWTPIFAGLDERMIEKQVRQATEWGDAGIAWYSAGLVEQHDRWELVRQR